MSRARVVGVGWAQLACSIGICVGKPPLIDWLVSLVNIGHALRRFGWLLGGGALRAVLASHTRADGVEVLSIVDVNVGQNAENKDEGCCESTAKQVCSHAAVAGASPVVDSCSPAPSTPPWTPFTISPIAPDARP